MDFKEKGFYSSYMQRQLIEPGQLHLLLAMAMTSTRLPVPVKRPIHEDRIVEFSSGKFDEVSH
jgi:hypothetical protein